MQSIKEKFQNLSVAEIVAYGVAALAAFIALCAVVSCIAGSGRYKQSMFSMEAQKSQLAGKLGQNEAAMGDAPVQQDGGLTDEQIADGVEGTIDSEGSGGPGDAAALDGDAVAPEDGSTGLVDDGMAHSAQQAGAMVATLQNQFVVLVADPSLGEAGESDRTQQRNAIVPNLQKYLAPDSTYMAASWFDPGQMYQNGKAPQFTWKFESPYSFRGMSLPVVWTCRNNRPSNESTSMMNAIAAYATATYDVASNTFQNVQVHTTEYGRVRLASYEEPSYDPPVADNGGSNFAENDEDGALDAEEGTGEPSGTVSGNDSGEVTSGTGTGSDVESEFDEWYNGDNTGTGTGSDLDDSPDVEPGDGQTTDYLGLPEGFFG